MKLTSLSKSVRTMGLITILSTIQGMSMIKTVQAQAIISAGAVCTDAYFDNPGYMYQAATKQQQAAIDKFEKDPERMKRWTNMMAEITTFSAPLDSPLGFVINKVNGENVAIPRNISKKITREVSGTSTKNNRQRAAEMNSSNSPGSRLD
jgi:hypothetical protein